MIKIGVLGCGFIGTQICRAIDKGFVSAELFAVYDTSYEKAQQLSLSLESQKPHFLTPSQMFENADLVVECASPDAAKSYVLDALKNDCDVLVMSAGVFEDPEFYKNAYEIAKENKKRIYIPSGAISGTDGLKSASSAKIDSVVLETRKPVSGLIDAPFVVNNKIPLKEIKEPTLIFEGKANEAVINFPKNVNVCATVSLCGIGFEKTIVRIIADPTINKNIHKLEVKGDFGEMFVEIKNSPAPTNPRTSYLAALSAISKLKEITNPFQIG